MMFRPILCGLAAVLLSSCASAPRPAAERPPRHYHGVVLNARTGAPVGYVSVTAYHQPFALPYVTPPDYLGFTLTRADGTFDLETSASRPPANHLEATANAPLANNTHPHQGELTGYNGVLNHVSTRRANTIRVRQIFAR